MDIGWPEIAIIAVVVLVLFGSKKLPDAARSLGRSMRILKTEIKSMHDDETPASSTTTAQLPVEAAPTTPAEPVRAGEPTSTP